MTNARDVCVQVPQLLTCDFVVEDLIEQGLVVRGLQVEVEGV